MKKRLICLLSLLPLLLLPLESSADKDKRPNDRAYEKANDNASFKRDDDKKKHEKKNKKNAGDKKHDKDDDDGKDKKKEKKKDRKDDKD
jgi:hypothetical protein